MANITTVNLTSGVPTGPTGAATVSTLDNLIGTTTTPCANIQTIQGNGAGTPVPISGTLNAAQSGAWTVGVSGTVTVTGSVSALQSGTWNITNVSGVVSLPTGAATAAKQPALGTGGVPSPDVITVQGISTGTALKVDGSAVTQPVSGTVGISGTVAASQSGVWNVGITGTPAVSQSGTWTTRIVGNTGSILDFNGQNQGSTNAQLAGGQFNTIPTTITTGNVSPLQLDSSANLLVNVKSSVLPTGAATGVGQASTTSGQSGTLVQGAVTTASPSYTSGQTSPLSLDTSGNLRVNVVAGGGAGGTSSSFGATFPPTGTAAGAEYLSSPPTLTTGQMVALQTDASGNLKVNIQAGAGSGGTAMADEAAFTFATTQGTPAMGVFQTTATNNALTTGQAGTWQMTANRAGFVNLRNAAGTELGTAGAPIRSDPVGTTTQPVSGTFWQTTQPVSGTFWQATQPISAASLPLPTGAATSGNQPSNSTLGATTSGQTGTLAIGAVTTAAPSYTTATSNALSLTTAGALRTDSSATTQPISGNVGITGTATVTGTVTANQGGTWTVQPGNTANTTAWLVTGTGGTFPVTGTFWQATQPVSGTVTAAQATAANLNATVVGTGTFAVQAAQSGNWTSRIVGNTGATLDTASTQNQAMPTNMLVTGAEYNTTPTAITSGNSSPLQTDTRGRLLTAAATRANHGKQKTSITTASETTVVTAGGAGVFNDIYAIVITNKSAASVFVDFKDSTAGTTQMTLAAPANDTRGFTVSLESAMPQTTAANNWTATVSGAVTSIEITVLYAANLA